LRPKDLEFVNEFLFNLDPALDPTALVFSAPVKAGLFVAPAISLGADLFMADGDGMYDIRLVFNTSASHYRKFGLADPPAFVETVSYTISLATLTAHSFAFPSFDMGGVGPFGTAAHIADINGAGQDSGWITDPDFIPEPATLALLAFGGVALLRRRR
jgi:hypothetical protein